MPWYCVCLFLFRTNCKKRHLNESDILTVMVVFSKVPFWKVLDHSYVQSSLSKITRYIDNSNLKETLQLKILQTWIKIRVNTFIKTWVNIMKQKRYLENYQLHKNPNLHFKEDCIKIGAISLTFKYASFSLKQTYFFNLTQCLSPYWIDFATIYLPLYLLIIDILRILVFI